MVKSPPFDMPSPQRCSETRRAPWHQSRHAQQAASVGPETEKKTPGSMLISLMSEKRVHLIHWITIIPLERKK